MTIAHVYVAGSSRNGPLKIGITVDPKRRLGELQTGNAVRLDIYWTLAVPADQARLIEQDIHGLFVPERMSGEWFLIPVEMAVEAIMRLTERLRPPEMTEVYPGLFTVGELTIATEADIGPTIEGYWGAGWVWYPPTIDPLDQLEL